jgi:GNAT superfamily N-acetyltransferase
VPTLSYRVATADDAADVLALVRRAYRGESSRAGWTTEADLLDDERIDLPGVANKINRRDGLVLLADDGAGALVACCELALARAGVGYFGMFAVEPTRQAGGLGRAVLAEAERRARDDLGAARMELAVIAARTDLIAWYERRGYRATGETRPFPYDELVGGPALRDDLYFVVLEKAWSTDDAAGQSRSQSNR